MKSSKVNFQAKLTSGDIKLISPVVT